MKSEMMDLGLFFMEQTEYIEDELVKELKLCANDLIYFGRKINPAAFFYDTPPFHYEIAKLFMDRSKTQVMVEAPRGFAKSTLSIFFILHHAIFDPGDKVIVIQSKTQAEAINRLSVIKSILDYSPSFKKLFGYCGQARATIWQEKKIKTKIGNSTVSIKAVGTGMPVRGMMEGSENEEDIEFTRITLYFLDDPDDEDNCNTKEQMDKNYSKFAGGKEGLDERTGRVLVLGTPIVEGCIVARLRNSTGWETRHYSACDEDTRECLWEEKRSFEWLMNKKKEYEDAGTLWKFYSEYQCVLKGKDDQVFKDEDFRFYDGEFLKGTGNEHFILLRGIYDQDKKSIELYDEPLKIPILTFIGVDPSFSLNPKADFSVVMPIGVDKDWNIYQFPYMRERVLMTDLVESIITMDSIYKPSRITIESGAQQDSVRQMVNLLGDKYFVGLGSKVASPKDSKNKRYIDILQYYHKNHKLMLNINHSSELKAEMVLHPSTTMHDDCNDGLYWAVKRAYTPDHELGEEDPIEKFNALYKKKVTTNNSWMMN